MYLGLALLCGKPSYLMTAFFNYYLVLQQFPSIQCPKPWVYKSNLLVPMIYEV